MAFNKLYLGLRAGANLSKFSVKTKSASTLSQTLPPDIPISSTLTNYTKLKLWLIEGTVDQKVGWVFYENTLLFALFGIAINQPSLRGFLTATDSGEGNSPFEGSLFYLT